MHFVKKLKTRVISQALIFQLGSPFMNSVSVEGAVPAFGMEKQEDHKFAARLGCPVRLYLKNTKKKNKLNQHMENCWVLLLQMFGIWFLSILIDVFIVYVLFHTSQTQPIEKDYIPFGGRYYTSVYSFLLPTASLVDY